MEQTPLSPFQEEVLSTLVGRPRRPDDLATVVGAETIVDAHTELGSDSGSLLRGGSSDLSCAASSLPSLPPASDTSDDDTAHYPPSRLSLPAHPLALSSQNSDADSLAVFPPLSPHSSLSSFHAAAEPESSLPSSPSGPPPHGITHPNATSRIRFRVQPQFHPASHSSTPTLPAAFDSAELHDQNNNGAWSHSSSSPSPSPSPGSHSASYSPPSPTDSAASNTSVRLYRGFELAEVVADPAIDHEEEYELLQVSSKTEEAYVLRRVGGDDAQPALDQLVPGWGINWSAHMSFLGSEESAEAQIAQPPSSSSLSLSPPVSRSTSSARKKRKRRKRPTPRKLMAKIKPRTKSLPRYASPRLERLRSDAGVCSDEDSELNDVCSTKVELSSDDSTSPPSATTNTTKITITTTTTTANDDDDDDDWRSYSSDESGLSGDALSFSLSDARFTGFISSGSTIDLNATDSDAVHPYPLGHNNNHTAHDNDDDDGDDDESDTDLPDLDASLNIRPSPPPRSQTRAKAVLVTCLSRFAGSVREYGVIPAAAAVMALREVCERVFHVFDVRDIAYETHQVVAEFDSAHDAVAAAMGLSGAVDLYNASHPLLSTPLALAGTAVAPDLVTACALLADADTIVVSASIHVAVMGSAIASAASFTSLDAGRWGVTGLCTSPLDPVVGEPPVASIPVDASDPTSDAHSALFWSLMRRLLESQPSSAAALNDVLAERFLQPSAAVLVGSLVPTLASSQSRIVASLAATVVSDLGGVSAGPPLAWVFDSPAAAAAAAFEIKAKCLRASLTSQPVIGLTGFGIAVGDVLLIPGQGTPEYWGSPILAAQELALSQATGGEVLIQDTSDVVLNTLFGVNVQDRGGNYACLSI